MKRSLLFLLLAGLVPVSCSLILDTGGTVCLEDADCGGDQFCDRWQDPPPVRGGVGL